MGQRFRKAKITAELVIRLGPGETIMDTSEPGFGIRRQGAGPCVYFVRKHANGLRHFQSIGEHGTAGLTVTSARDKAERIIRSIKDGASPAERRARERAMPTVEKLSVEWMAAHVEAKRKPKTVSAYRSLLNTRISPSIGNVRVDQLTEAQVARMHVDGKATPYVANRAIAVLSKMMNWAERQGYRPKGSNPCKGLERFREHKRDRFLTNEELIRLGEALASEEAAGGNPFALAAIRLLILTGARLNEILELEWDHVDLGRGLLLLPDSKTGRKAIHLSAPAAAILDGMPLVEGNPHVIVGGSEGGHLYDLKKPWQRVRKAAELDGVRIHDLRHSFASIALAHGGSLSLIGKLLGHQNVSTTARYAHLAADPVRELNERAGQAIARAIVVSSPTKSQRPLSIQRTR